MGIYEDWQIHTKTGFDQSNCKKAGPALILIERHLIIVNIEGIFLEYTIVPYEHNARNVMHKIMNRSRIVHLVVLK